MKTKHVLILGGLLLLTVAFYNVWQNLETSPQKTWNLLLIALQEANLRQVRKLTTQEVLEDLQQGKSENEYLSDWQRWGEGWSEESIRWEQIDEATVMARLGPEIKEHGFVFVKESGLWRLAQWHRGQ